VGKLFAVTCLCLCHHLVPVGITTEEVLAVYVKGLAFRPYIWVVFALAASLGFWKRRWAPLASVTELLESAVVDYQRFNITATARYAAIITTKTWRARVLVTKKMLRCKKSLLYYRRHKRFCIPALRKISGKLKCCENVTVTELPTTTLTTTTTIPTATPVLVRRKVCAKCPGNYINFHIRRPILCGRTNRPHGGYCPFVCLPFRLSVW